MAVAQNTLVHLYGIADGIYLATFILLLFFAISHFNKRNNSIFFELLAIAGIVGLFASYSLYTLKVFVPVSHIYTVEMFFLIGKYATPLALAGLTFGHTKFLANNSITTFSIIRKNVWGVRAIYTLCLAVLLALSFISDDTITIAVCHALIVYVLAFNIFVTYKSYKTFRYSRIILLLSLTSLLFIFQVLYDLYQGKTKATQPMYLIAYNTFSVVLLVYAFISIILSQKKSQNLNQLKTTHEHGIAMDLRHAIVNDHLYLLYQPKLNLHDNSVCGVEALVRWQHPEKGIISPADFIPIVEKTGMIDDVCFWVVEAVIKQAADFKRQQLDIPISINFSADNLKPHVIGFLIDTLQYYDVDASAIQIEITETFILEMNENKQKSFEMLKSLDVSLSMDDYGTGYSSLTYIKDLSLKEIKIDGSFIYELDTRMDNMVIVDSIIQMSKALNITVTAEGVETKNIRDLLQDMGCHVIQGYYLSKPVSIPSLMLWMQETNTLPQRSI